jgi:hypothetical protein
MPSSDDRRRNLKASAERMATILETGRWPTGTPLTARERYVMERNRARMLDDLDRYQPERMPGFEDDA